MTDLNEQSEVRLEPCPQITYPLRVEPEPGYKGIACILDASSILIAAMMYPEHARIVVDVMNTSRASVASPRGDARLVDREAAAEVAFDAVMATQGRCYSLTQTAAIVAANVRKIAAPVGTGESGWLLEKMHNGQVHYISADYVLQWTDDPNKALRLARRKDAEALCTIVDDCEKIASHEWVPAVTSEGDK